MDVGGKCSSGAKDEQLYMVELLVDKLNLSPDKKKEAGATPLCVRMKFVDFPVFEISQAEFVSAKKQREKEAATNPEKKTAADQGLVDFSAGKSCLFTKQPRDLVQAMQSRPLKIGVYKISEKLPCGGVFEDDGGLCATLVPLSGCLCDQVAMAMNDAEHLPKPYTLKNTYNLIDDRAKPSGTIAIFLRLSCFGKSIVTHFAFQEKSFLFKSSQSGDEFQCTRVTPDEEELARREQRVTDTIRVPRGESEPEEDPFPKPRDVIGLAPICQELAKRDGGPAHLRPPIRVPSKPPKIGMDQPGFEKLTSAEKLNDREYRGQVYRTFPDEPICSCVCSPGGNFLKSLTGDFPCTGAACGGGCCIGTRRLEPQPRDYHGGSAETPCYTGSCCSGSPKIEGNAFKGCYGGPRMRGGGCCGGNSGGSNVLVIPKNNSFNGCRPGPPPQSMETLMAGTCSSPPLQEGAQKKPGCGCFGNSSAGEGGIRAVLGKGAGSCTKKPCLGIDCLLRAFKETQEFVDAIGKVPGLAGLGLQDPSESPYFGRERDAPENTCAPKKSPGFGSSQQPRSPSIPFLAKNQTSGHRGSPPPSFPVPSNIYAPAMTGKTGVVREAILPSKKKDVDTNPQTLTDIELGPCGEVRCRSRRKKPQEEMQAGEAQGGVSLPKKIPNPGRPNSGGGVSKTNGVQGGGGRPVVNKPGKTPEKAPGPQTIPGPAGDRAAVWSTKSNVKVSKRVMKFVYTTGALYPGINYGHKNCQDLRMRVPANMGWLWNTNSMVGRLKPRLGWKPGAISRFLNELFKQVKVAGSREQTSRPTSASSKSRKGNALKNKNSPSVQKGQVMPKKKDAEEAETELPPTLHIHRKDGTYYVTMYPIKQETMEVPQLQEPMKPLQFKITKNKDDASIASSSTASDMEIEFSPPAAVNRYRKKPNVIHVDTQVKQQEILDAFKPPDGKKTKGNAKVAGKKGKKK